MNTIDLITYKRSEGVEPESIWHGSIKGVTGLQLALSDALVDHLRDYADQLDDANGAIEEAVGEREDWDEAELIEALLDTLEEHALANIADVDQRVVRRADVERTVRAVVRELWPRLGWERIEGERARDYSAFIAWMLSAKPGQTGEFARERVGGRDLKRAARWRWEERAAEWDAAQARQLVAHLLASRPSVASALSQVGARLLTAGVRELVERMAELKTPDLIAVLNMGRELRAEGERYADDAALDALLAAARDESP